MNFLLYELAILRIEAHSLDKSIVMGYNRHSQ